MRTKRKIAEEIKDEITDLFFNKGFLVEEIAKKVGKSKRRVYEIIEGSNRSVSKAINYVFHYNSIELVKQDLTGNRVSFLRNLSASETNLNNALQMLAMYLDGISPNKDCEGLEKKLGRGKIIEYANKLLEALQKITYVNMEINSEEKSALES
ncbi:MAG: hypothetical protein NTZ83_03235 [Candidatus Pacearchaeota archaeon]|nr:hypothetical protein [Candidatus Pacearchaeota archaeon]